MLRKAIAAGLIVIALAAGIVFGQSRFRRYTGNSNNRWAQYEAEMQNPVDDPPDAAEQTEFAFARLRYRSLRDRRGFYGRSRWGIDANKSDRLFIQSLRRLTRIHARSIEQIVDIDSDEIFDWP